MNKLVKTKELYECNVPYLKELFDSCEYPWEMLSKIKELCNELVKTGINGFKELKPGVLVGENVTIAETATIIAPAIIGHNTEIRPGAFIRGNVITGDGVTGTIQLDFADSTALTNITIGKNILLPIICLLF